MKDSLAEVSQTGAFVRTDSEFRATSLPSVEPEDLSSRYHLYVSNACPWAHRALIVRKLKGLEGAVGLSVVHPTWGQTRPDKDEHKGWIFRSEDDASVVPPCGVGSIANAGVIPDVVNQAPDVRALYEIAGAGAANKFTVPILWDKADSTIINNESSEIIRLMNTEFNAVANNPNLDLYPEHLRAEIDAVNEWIYPNINNGVYRCGFAKSQAAYDEAVEGLFGALDRVEEILLKRRYLTGDTFTEADIRLFVTLIRFDEVYVVYFKCNVKCVREYSNIRNYMREIYQMPGVAETTNMDHIKNHYFTSHAALNAYAVVPRGPDVVADMQLEHDRARL
eukprot:CAMPEP_0182556224 /NCGR_PEP_ID=MMETSP1324-20130603/564_1 /TAXON_ID=236786 /ORGANISM="Florenciella sp., Strain RCC1587" /LENGTH=335 /DNA_ID=CAMNT_0024768081 /DNA_START=94 /DNA_END=1101 /DNA_ORIENTATION=-